MKDHPLQTVTEGAQTFHLAKVNENHLTMILTNYGLILSAKEKVFFTQISRLHESDKSLLLQLCAYFLNDQQLCATIQARPQQRHPAHRSGRLRKNQFYEIVIYHQPQKRNHSISSLPATSLSNFQTRVFLSSKSMATTKVFVLTIWV